MNRFMKTLLSVIAVSVLFGCSAPAEGTAAAGQSETEETKEEEKEMILKIDGVTVPVTWEENDAVAALREAVQKEPLDIQMTMYGGFEQVGQLGFSLPAEDEPTDTEAGDIVLYTGNMIVIFYGTNSWDYTRLGHVDNRTEQEMQELLANGNVRLTVAYE